MKIKRVGTPSDFNKLERSELHQLWFNEKHTDKEISKMYGVSIQEVKTKRNEMNLTMWTCAWLWALGGEKFADKRKLEKERLQIEKQLRRK